MPILLSINRYSQDSKVLYQLLQSRPKKLVWSKTGKYNMNNQTYCLSNTIIVIQSDNSEERYFKVLSNPIYTDHKTKIFPVVLSFTLSSNEETVQYFDYKPQIVKSVKYNRNVLNEYEKSRIVGHLEMHPPIIYGDFALLLMLRMPGIDLCEFISVFDKEKISLPIKFLFMLIDSTLQALLHQVVTYKLIHRDIKLENLIIDLEGLDVTKKSKKEYSKILNPNSITSMKINCIDYAFCINFNEPTEYFAGTKEYLSPECKDKIFNNEKPDIYATGIILQIFLGLDLLAKFAIKQENGEKLITNEILDTIYEIHYSSRHNDISYSTFLKLSILAINMAKTQPSERWSLQQSIMAFEYIISTSSFDKKEIFKATRPSNSLDNSQEETSSKDEEQNYKIINIIIEAFKGFIKLITVCFFMNSRENENRYHQKLSTDTKTNNKEQNRILIPENSSNKTTNNSISMIDSPNEAHNPLYKSYRVIDGSSVSFTDFDNTARTKIAQEIQQMEIAASGNEKLLFFHNMQNNNLAENHKTPSLQIK